MSASLFFILFATFASINVAIVIFQNKSFSRLTRDTKDKLDQADQEFYLIKVFPPLAVTLTALAIIVFVELSPRNGIIILIIDVVLVSLASFFTETIFWKKLSSLRIPKWYLNRYKTISVIRILNNLLPHSLLIKIIIEGMRIKL